MNEFIFTAKNDKGVKVTERVEAASLSQARYALECRGYEDIQFHTNELSNEVYEMHGETAKENIRNASPEYIVEAGKASFLSLIWLFFSHHWHLWAGVFGVGLAFCWLTGISLYWAALPPAILFVIALYLLLPSLLFTELTKAVNMADWPEVRKWGKIISASNKVNVMKIPAFWLDAQLAYADAANGNLAGALGRLKKHESDPKVSKPLYYTAQAGVYSVMSDKEKLTEYRKLAMEHSGNRAEETLDYAMALARFFGKTGEARALIQSVYEGELTALNAGLASFATGVLECEEGNYERAEFHFLHGEAQLRANASPDLLGGLFNMMKAYFVLIYAKKGDYHKAEEAFNEAHQYLVAHKETDLLEKCKKALA